MTVGNRGYEGPGREEAAWAVSSPLDVVKEVDGNVVEDVPRYLPPNARTRTEASRHRHIP